MVNVTNARTGWDHQEYAGQYIVLDIKHCFYAWHLLQMRHIVDYKAPDDPARPAEEVLPLPRPRRSGHFQVGRGYNKRGDKPDLIRYFEPWNQQRFHRSEPFIERRQQRSAYRTYRANLAHFQHNVGV